MQSVVLIVLPSVSVRVAQSDKKFLQNLENGVRFGKWILLENVSEKLDAALEPILLQQKFKQGGSEMIKLGDSVIPYNDSFRFFITSKLPNPHFPPEVAVKVSLLNFTITPKGLEDQMLGVFVVRAMLCHVEHRTVPGGQSRLHFTCGGVCVCVCVCVCVSLR
jgi:hypothetical protein